MTHPRACGAARSTPRRRTRARRAAATALALAAATTLAACSAPGTPTTLSDEEAKPLIEAVTSIILTCRRGPLTPEQVVALRPRVQRLVAATKEDPEALFEFPQADDNPLPTSTSYELQAVVGTLGGVGPQRACNRALAREADRGLTDIGRSSMLKDMPSTAR